MPGKKKTVLLRNNLILLLLMALSSTAYAGVTCTGRVDEIVRLPTAEDTSVRLENSNRFFTLRSNTDLALALAAFAKDTDLQVQWADESISSCNNGWDDHQPFVGNVSVMTSHQPSYASVSYFKSCQALLNAYPAKPSGSYLIDPDGAGDEYHPTAVYCDMNYLGGWTLIARGIQGDADFWFTANALNVHLANTQHGATFKFSDKLINLLAVNAYRVNSKDDPRLVRFFKPDCVYNQISISNQACSISYQTPNWTGASHGNYPRGDMYGLWDWREDGDFSVITSERRDDGWIIGRKTEGFKNAQGQYVGDLQSYNFSSSFFIWVR